jgi:hypothetical protein
MCGDRRENYYRQSGSGTERERCVFVCVAYGEMETLAPYDISIAAEPTYIFIRSFEYLSMLYNVVKNVTAMRI